MYFHVITVNIFSEKYLPILNLLIVIKSDTVSDEKMGTLMNRF